MNAHRKYFLSAPGVATAQGCSREALAARFFAETPRPLSRFENFPVGLISDELPAIAEKKFDLRVNRLLLHCLNQIGDAMAFAKTAFPRGRIGVVVGNSNAGIREAERGMREHRAESDASFQIPDYLLSPGNPAEFLKKYAEVGGPAYAISTACSSGGKAFSSAKNLLEGGICDAVIVGAADSFSPFVQRGFASLGLVSAKPSAPFSRERDGINIGEGAALFLMTKTPLPAEEKIALWGVGESSDAYHLTSPSPDGFGAKIAMRAALADAALAPSDIDYINLHGTGTPANDAAEGLAIAEVFGEKIPPCSSSKPFFGHTLGAAGAIEAALCALALSQKYNPEKILPLHPAIYTPDPACGGGRIPFAGTHQRAAWLEFCLSNAFAFGGSNASIILGK